MCNITYPWERSDLAGAEQSGWERTDEVRTDRIWQERRGAEWNEPRELRRELQWERSERVTWRDRIEERKDLRDLDGGRRKACGRGD